MINQNKQMLLFWDDLLGSWRIFLVALCLFGTAGYFYVETTPKIFSSSIRVAPVSSDSSSLGGLSSKIGGIAAGLVGFNIATSGVESDVVALETLRSSQFLLEFLKSNDAVPIVMAATSFDKLTGDFQFDESVYDPEKGIWIEGRMPPTWSVLKRFNKDFLFVEKEGKTGVISIEIRSLSPQLSAEWSENIVQQLNDYMKEKALSSASRNLTYLSEQLLKTELTEMRNVFYSLIEEQYKSMMFATAKDEYALRVLSQPVKVDVPISPNVPFVCIAIIFASVFISLLVVFVGQFKKVIRS